MGGGEVWEVMEDMFWVAIMECINFIMDLWRHSRTEASSGGFHGRRRGVGSHGRHVLGGRHGMYKFYNGFVETFQDGSVKRRVSWEAAGCGKSWKTCSGRPSWN